MVVMGAWIAVVQLGIRSLHRRSEGGTAWIGVHAAPGGASHRRALRAAEPSGKTRSCARRGDALARAVLHASHRLAGSSQQPSAPWRPDWLGAGQQAAPGGAAASAMLMRCDQRCCSFTGAAQELEA